MSTIKTNKWWAARDYSGELYIYSVRPRWVSERLEWRIEDGGAVRVNESLLPNLNYEDQPIVVEIDLKLVV